MRCAFPNGYADAGPNGRSAFSGKDSEERTMNEKSKGDSRPLWTVRKAVVNFLLVSTGAACAGALYTGVCGAIIGLVQGGWWPAAFSCGQRGALAGLAAGVLTMTFGGTSFSRLMSVRETLVPTRPRATLRADAVRTIKRRPSWQSASRSVQNANPPVSAAQETNDSSNNYFAV
jgi:hypothetical protein